MTDIDQQRRDHVNAARVLREAAKAVHAAAESQADPAIKAALLDDEDRLNKQAKDQAEPRPGLLGLVRAHQLLATYAAALTLLVLGYVVGFGVHKAWFAGKEPFEIAGSLSVFAVLFVLALAIERMIQPFAPKLGPDSSEAKQTLTKAEQLPDETAGKAVAIAHAKRDVDDARERTAIVTWGAASALGFILSAALNVTMMGTVLARGQQPRYWVDLLVTGFVIGAGTKPLNDLVTRLQDKGDG